MTRSWFPDLIGPSSVAANGSTAVGIRAKRLNILSSGAVVADNATKRRTDLTMPTAEWVVYPIDGLVPGEWLPASHNIVAADLLVVDPTVSGIVLTGLDSGVDPTKLIKYIANIGTNSIDIQPPASPISGKQYFSGAAYTLTANSTVRVAWDSVSRVYRVRGTAPVVSASLIVLDGNPLALGGDHVLNPT